MTRFCTCTGGLATTLELGGKRKKIAKASCNTCGRPLVDGIRPLSSSMLGMVAPELTEFINPDLTWKTVTKGFRSATRRSRRPAARSLNLGVRLDDKSPNRVDSSSVSESEKLGVAVLGQRFGDKIEHVPIKKRRLLLRSPSPPPWSPSPCNEESLSPQLQTPSPHPEEPKRLIDRKCPSDRWDHPGLISSCQMGVSDGSMAVQSHGVGVMIGKLDDFSGIALLAAAACNNNIGDEIAVEEEMTQQGIESSVSAKPLEETAPSFGNGSFFSKDLPCKDNVEHSIVQDNPVCTSVPQNLHQTDDDGVVKSSLPTKDDRLHWDLNTVMDAWAEPCDDPNVCSERNVSEVIIDNDRHGKLENLKSCEIQKCPEDVKYDTESKVQVVCKTVSTDACLADQRLFNSGDIVLEAGKSNTEEHKLEACSGAERISFKEKSASTLTESGLEPPQYGGVDAKASNQIVNINTSPACSESVLIASTCISEEKSETTTTCGGVLQNKEGCHSLSAMQLDKIVSSECSDLVKHHPDSLDVPVSETAECEIDRIQSKDPEHCSEISGLPDSTAAPTKVFSSVTCQLSDTNCIVEKLDKTSTSCSSPKHKNFPVLGTSIVEDESLASVDTKGLHDKTSATGTAPMASALDVEPEESWTKSIGQSVSNVGFQSSLTLHDRCKSHTNSPTNSCQVAIQGPSGNCFEADVSQNGLGQVFGVEHMTELQAGYDSPFEDGELRDPIAYAWEENEMEGETECVDYGSDNDFDSTDFSIGEKNEVEQCGRKDVPEEPSHSASLNTKFSGWDQLPESHAGSNDKTAEVNDGSTKVCTSDPTDELDKRELSTMEIGSRASRGKLLCVEGPSCSNAIHSKTAVFRQRSRCRNLGDSYLRAERELGAEKFTRKDRSVLEVHDRTQEDDHWVDSSLDYWDSRYRYPTSFHVSHGPGHPRRRSIIPDMAGKVEGITSRDHRRSINYHSGSIYRPSMRRRSPIDRDDVYGMHRRTLPVRDIGCGRSRGRSGIYSQGLSRGPRDEEYHGPISENPMSTSVRVPHYLTRRERSLSPIPGRGAHFSRPRRKSQSRSRTRSPLPWHLQRERNSGSRCHSRSPDFQAEGRIKRLRLPFSKSSFPDDEESLGPRGRISPQYNSRWIDERNCVADHLRERTSPVRLFRRGQRFDSVGSPGRLKSEDYFRHMVRRGRFTEMPGGLGRGHKYEDSDDDRRRKGDRYEMIHRIRRFDTGLAMTRFRYDAEQDCFEAPNPHSENDCTRVTGRRNVPRSGREERGRLRYNHERMYISSPRSSGFREYEEDASPRRG